MEYLNEKFPEKQMYPSSQQERAMARSLANEMHAGFSNLRQHLNMHLKKSFQNFDHSPAAKDLERIKSLWENCLKKSDGPFLFSKLSIVDAMYTPVVCRFKTYGVPVYGLVKGYCETILELPAVQQWYEEARKEDFIAVNHD